ncbi:hypothetical protein Nepgr_001743 [Nepenthes gracilis]|uniref:Uncharacterized protein n=1 Tax=Nepenthes gracilis TaxID=150966 RepID=A0AAD3P8Q0_NEPGR|nr:hypothetical protein Nepgr_001743 [Nepenthes gracilis]
MSHGPDSLASFLNGPISPQYSGPTSASTSLAADHRLSTATDFQHLFDHFLANFLDSICCRRQFSAEGDSLVPTGARVRKLLFFWNVHFFVLHHCCCGSYRAAPVERQVAGGATGAKFVVEGALSSRALACELSNSLGGLRPLLGFEASSQLASAGAEDPPGPSQRGELSYIKALR